MDMQSLDPKDIMSICEMSNLIIGALEPSGFYLATIAGKGLDDRASFDIETGGFGLLQHSWNFQTVVYSDSGHVNYPTRRHACNIWFSNAELEARVDRWVIDVFNQDSEAKLTPFYDQLVEHAEGRIEFHLNCRRGPVRPERTLADYGLGIRK